MVERRAADGVFSGLETGNCQFRCQHWAFTWHDMLCTR